MWKKDDDAPVGPETQAKAAGSRGSEVPSRPPAGASRASIGRSITIRGEVTGEEDLLIEGHVDGAVDLKEHAVTVGTDGQVKAGVSGRVVTVEGTVDGDLSATEMVILRSTAQVQGDITAPRVVLEDGASFRGGVDMGETVDNASRRRARGPALTGAEAKSAPSSAGAASKGPEGESGKTAQEETAKTAS